MKKLNLRALAAALTIGCATLSASAVGPDLFNHLGANLQVGTNGITIEAATKLTRFVDVRAGVDFMPGFHINTDADYTVDLPPEYASYAPSSDHVSGTVDLEGSMKRTQGHLIFNVYPVPGCSFYVAAGAYFAGNKLLKISGHTEIPADVRDASVLIGDFKLPVDENGDVDGGLKVNNFRPYLGLGFGRAVPKRLLNFGFELGVQMQGKPKLYSNNGEIETSLIEDDNTYQKIMKYLKVYPTISFKLQFRAL